MAIEPSGVPAWQRTNDHTTYGGDTQKTNYHGQATVDARTDIAAAQFCRMAADLAACMRTAPFATMTYTCNDSSDDPTINSYDAMAGDEPTATREGDGDATFEWASSYTDEYGVEGDIHITAVDATVHSTTAAAAQVELVDSSTIRVRALSDAGAAVVDAKVTVTIYTGQV